MDDSSLRAELEARHGESFGWALCCCRRDRHRAEDVLQRAYLKVLSGAAKFEGRGAFKTWLLGVIRMTALDERRRHWLGSLKLLAYSRQQQEPPVPEEAEAADPETQAAFRAALEELAPRQRRVLHLVFYQELSLSEAAQVMGITVGSARQHYDRGKRGLRQRLGSLKEFQEQRHDAAG